MKTKRLLLSLMSAVAISFFTTAISAQPVLTKGAENRKAPVEMLDKGTFVGQIDDLYCFIGNSRRNYKEITLINGNLVVVRQTQVEVDDAEVVAAVIEGNMLNILAVDRSEKKMTVISTGSVDLDNIKSQGKIKKFLTGIDTIRHEKKDRCYVWAAQSPDGRYMGYVDVLEKADKKQYASHATLLDGQLNRLWQREYAFGVVDEMVVTNQGEIVTFGYEQVNSEVEIGISIVSEDNQQSYTSKANTEPLRELRVAGMIGRTLVAMGTTRPEGVKEKKDLCSGVAAYTFNLDSVGKWQYTLRPFLNEDINILMNQKTKKTQKLMMADMVSVIDRCTTDSVAVIALGRNYSQTKNNDDGTINERFYRDGIHMVAVSADGRVAWARNLRRSDMQTNSNSLLSVNLLPYGDEVVVFRSEHQKQPAIYDIANAAKQLEMGDKSNLVFYRITPSGDVSKTTIELKTPLSVMRTERRDDGRYLIITANTSTRARAALIEIR